MRYLVTLIAVFATLSAAASAQAPKLKATASIQQPQLNLPIDCTPGTDCWLVNHVDVDPVKGKKRDYRCGPQTYDKHKGTDFSVADLSVMRRGVKVIASAPGVVAGIRDGMDDVNFASIDPKSIKGRECGNGVMIKHGGGWSTQYCHLRKGSVRVRGGDKIARGQVLGLVGLSGKTIFPHVHLTARHGKRVIDPFLGLDKPGKCTLGRKPLWAPETLALLAYKPGKLYLAGVSDTTPNAKRIRNGEMNLVKAAPNAKGLFLWADAYWTKAGDKVSFRLVDPKGKQRIDSTVTLKRGRARQLVFMGTKRTWKGPWPSGTYQWGIRLMRDTPKGTRILGSMRRTLHIP